jgi:hypothetical protein
MTNKTRVHENYIYQPGRLPIAALLFVALSGAALGAAADLPPGVVEFNRDIQPILSDRCFACHGPDKANRKTELRFDNEASAFAALPSGGFAIVRGDSAASKMVQRVASDDAALRMPPAYLGHDKLNQREIRLITRWVDQGAKWQKHWAFITAKRPARPRVQKKDWPSSEMDYFVLRRLEREGLQPSPQASRTTLIRRATLDLTGLPPTPAEVDAFLNDPSPAAYQHVVERLLESPRYGERMAYRWLDAARYADTNGYQNDRPRDMWRWRDWVIEAFNNNMPFDQFTIEQIAGDLLPNATLDQKIATGFNRNHRGNAENGTDPDEYQVEYAVDRVDTTATVWLGLTMGCARCHDHKYDPITQKEFYRFFAYFNNVSDRGRYFKYGNTPPIVHAPTVEQQAGLADLDGKMAATAREFSSLQATMDEGMLAWAPSAASGDLDWSFEERLAAKPGTMTFFNGNGAVDLGDQGDYDFYDKFTLAARVKPARATGGIISRYLPSPKGYGLFLIDGKPQFRIDTSSISDRMRIETVTPIALNEWAHVAATYDGSRVAAGMKIYVNGEDQAVTVLIDESLNSTNAKAPLRIGFGPDEDSGFQGLIDDARVYDRALNDDEVAVVAAAESLSEIAASPAAARSPGQSLKLRWAYLSRFAPEKITRLWNKTRKLYLERERFLDSLPTVMVMDERSEVRPTHVLERGAFDAPRERVESGLPAVLPPLPAGQPNNRLGLARWIVDRSNPLTARVTVNRFWQMLFGAGLVKSVENFGSQGDWPVHPELLDWLAVEFMESGWDVKGILKTILMSATYRQSSKVTPQLLEKDSENRLLARGPRVRLAAESVRDQALAISGLLVDERGGPSVRPYQPAGLWKELSNWDAYQHDEGQGLYRRSLYTFWKRTIAPPAMMTFDSSDRETCVVTETRTNTPLQALNLMNDVTYTEASRLFAERMMKEGGATPDERLSYGFRLAAARQPADEEREILLRSFHRYWDRYQTNPDDAAQYLSTGEHPRDETLPSADLAAYTALASLILNLDETITKQ